MRVLAGCVVALCLIASPAMAGANGAGGNAGADSSAASANNANASASSSASAKPETVTSESELQQLKDLIEAQSKQIEAQGQALKEQQQEMQALKQQLNAGSSNGGTISAAPIAASVVTAPVAGAIGPVVGAPTANAAISSTSPAQQASADQPASIKYKGITLTPSGFFAGEAVWRQKAMASDVNTPFNSVVYSGASQAHMDEINGSGRQSRIAMLAQGKTEHASFTGYYEFDFLSAGTTSNNNQSNSYTARQRQFWGQVASNNGISLTAGQQWSLLTETTTGMNNRTENLPMTIDAQYHVGFSWARQFGVRLVKNFNNKFWLGLSVEQGQATVTVHGNPTVNAGGTTVCTNATCTTTAVINPTAQNNFLLGAFGTGGGLYNPLGNYQFNPSPDIIVKATWEPGFGHYEVFGLFSEFRDRVFPCVPINGTTQGAGCPAGSAGTSGAGAYNSSRTGGGGGLNARWAIMSNKVDKLDVGIHVLGGSGIGRYGSAGLADATTRPDGTLALIRNYQALGTIQLHPVPKMDIYFNAGVEYEDRAQYFKAGAGPTFGGSGTAATENEGYGYVGLNNSGCWTETQPITGPSTGSNTGVPTGVGGSTGFIPGPLANCTGDTRNIVEGTVGFWYRFYNGPMGRFQWGMQLSDYVRNSWHGTGAAGPAGALGTSGQPTANQNMVFTSFRYYLP
jgi:hypothetical protein